jgi:hypothetical protein
VFSCLAAALVAVAAAAPLAALEIQAADERPLKGAPVRLTVTEGTAPAAGARIEAVYRPNSSTSSTEALPAADSAGTVFWTPRAAGPVRLSAWPAGAGEGGPPAAQLTVAVRYGSFPPAGLLIMVVAGVLLLGGAAFGMIMLLRPPGQPPLEEPPST